MLPPAPERPQIAERSQSPQETRFVVDESGQAKDIQGRGNPNSIEKQKFIADAEGGIAKTFGVDPEMYPGDEAGRVFVDNKHGFYKNNPTAKNITSMLTESGKIGNKQMSGEFMYAVNESGEIAIGTRAGERMPHPTLVGGENPRVQAAGILDYSEFVSNVVEMIFRTSCFLTQMLFFIRPFLVISLLSAFPDD